MLIIKDVRKLYGAEKVMFPPDPFSYKSKSDITKYLRLKCPPDSLCNGICYTNNTLFTDLSLSEDDLLANFSRTTKQQIRKCIREEATEISIEFYTWQDLKNNDSILADFKSTYMSYCDHGNHTELKKYYSDRNIDQYIEHRCILISKAAFPNGKVYHLYVWDQEDSLFEYNASDHLNEEVVGILAGMANKWLVYNDMLWLKAHGVINYDWGGIFSFEKPNGIDRFKMLFGGRRAQVYNCYLGNTIKGKILVRLKKFQDSIRNISEEAV